MFGALLKKQLLEFTKPKARKKKKQSKYGMLIVYAIIFVLLFVVFGFISYGCSLGMLGNGNDWSYYSFLATVSIFLAVFINVFATYSGLYKAKDNDLLLSLPLKPIQIIISRVLVTYLLGLFFTISTFLPGVIIGWISRSDTFATIVFPVIALIAMSLLVLTLTCIIGWVVAFLSSKFKNKSLVTAIVGMIALGAWIAFGNRMFSDFAQYFIHLGSSDSPFKRWWNPLYLMGESAAGDIVSLLILLAMVAILFVLAMLIISKSFWGIVTSQKTTSKKSVKKETIKQKSIKNTLFKKELTYYTKNSTLMLNTGLGVLFVIGLTVFAMIKLSDLSDIIPQLQTLMPEIINAIPLAFAILACIILSLGNISVSSISLEGNRIWLLQSLPIQPKKIFDAKRNLHFMINAIPTLICLLVLNIFLKMDPTMISFSVIYAGIFIFLQGDFGLILDMKRPILDWTNEVVAIKQNTNVLLAWLIGWALLIISGALIFFGTQYIGIKYATATVIIIMLILCMLVEKWLGKKGEKVFCNL